MLLAHPKFGIAHVGLGKTGSTFLQKHYFANLPLRFYSTQSPFTWPDALGFVYQGNALWYEDLFHSGAVLTREEREHRYAVRTQAKLVRWQHALSAFRMRQENHWLVSSEGLCGLSPDVCALHMSLLKQAGVSKIFFVCRQQAAFAQSLWRQFLLAEDRFARFIPFDVLFGGCEREGVIDLDWNAYIQTMDANFGAENVLALPYELLLAAPTAFFRRLNAFLGLADDAYIPDSSTRENPSRVGAVYRGLTFDASFPFNRLGRVRCRLHRLAARYAQMVPDFMYEEHSMLLGKEVLDTLQHRFATANRHLEARLGIDLKGYGYY